MISSKLFSFAKLGVRNAPRFFSTSAIRKGGHTMYYREFPPQDSKVQIYATICGSMMWWWIFWHVFTDYEHLIGHHEYPCVEKWTDEELGIPPDDADDPE